MWSLPRILLSRRRILRLSLLGGLVTGIQAMLGGAAAQLRVVRDPLAALPAFLDTLLPADGASPAASALGIDRTLLSRAPRRRQRLLTQGCRWLDYEARRRGAEDFTSLDQSARNEIVAAAESSPRRSLPWGFFETVRRAAMPLYYADARTWPALGYDGPPQPAGFPDHASPPKGQR